MNNINRYKPSFTTMHSQDYYQGKSFNYAGEWRAGMHYVNDQYVQDFVTYKGSLLACQRSHISNCDNEPKIVYKNNKFPLQASSVESSYWDLALVGLGSVDVTEEAITNLIKELVKTTSIDYVEGKIVYKFGDEIISRFQTNVITDPIYKKIESVSKQFDNKLQEIVGNHEDSIEKNSIFGVRNYIDYILSWEEHD